MLAKLKRHIELKEFLLFGVSGVLAFLVDVAITTVMEPLLGVYLARIPAFVAGATTTWLLNRSVTFRKRESVHTSLIKEYLHYVSLMIFGLIVNYIAYSIAITILKPRPYAIVLSIAIGSLAGMTINYLNSRRYIFANGTNEKQESAK